MMSTNRQYRMSFNEIYRPLKAIYSSRELVVSVRDAMEAHDKAYFDAHILHRDINITNIVTSATGRGLLIDWELSVDCTSFRPTGTWEYDRESAVHMLTLLALRHINHHKLDHVVSAYLSVYNQIDHQLSDGIITGGLYKGDRFASSMFPTFASDPLNRIFSALRKTFSARYVKIEMYSSEKIRGVQDFLAYFNITDPQFFPLPYLYAYRMESLEKPNWLVEVFNEHLDSEDWPSDDRALANPLPL